MKKISIIWVLALLLLLTVVTSIPEPAAEYYGQVQIGDNLASTQKNITAFDNSGNTCGSFTTTVLGYFGLLSCASDDDQTSSDEGGSSGTNVTFYIDGNRTFAFGNVSWHAGRFNEVRLFSIPNQFPFFLECENTSTLEDTPLPTANRVDLWPCTYDHDSNDSELTYSVASHQNASLISCSIASGRYVDCATLGANLSGSSLITVQAHDGTGGKNTTINITVYSVNDPPYFSPNILGIVINESSELYLDVNCSDHEGDTIRYYDNTSLFTINKTSGEITFTPGDLEVANHSLNLSCGDGSLNGSEIFYLNVSDINNQPSLTTIGNISATEKIKFTLEVRAGDSDNDSLNFSSNATIFNIITINDSNNITIGYINFTPTFSQIGNYSINISVNDGDKTDYEIVFLTIERGAYCGNSQCNGDESCSVCPTDCGSCPSVPTVPGSGSGSGKGTGSGSGVGGGQGGGGGGGGGGRARECSENWECSDWEDCAAGKQKRKCTDSNKCRTTFTKPNETRSCTAAEIILPSCSDRIKNQNEENIDCGGICPACPAKPLINVTQYAQSPALEAIASLHFSRQFPWIMLIILSLLVLPIIAGDFAYMKHIRSAKYDDYVEKHKRYRKTRKRMYETIINITLILIVISVYMYIFSDCSDCMKRFSIPAGLSLIVIPLIVSFLIKRFEYSEFVHQQLEQRSTRTHQRQTRQLRKIENDSLIDLETMLLAKSKEAHAKIEEIIQLKTIITRFAESDAVRKKLSPIKIEFKMFEKMTEKTKSAWFSALAREYPEFALLLQDLKAILAHAASDEEEILYEYSRNFIDDMKRISSDKQLISVIKSLPDSIINYNELVDIYNYLAEQDLAMQQSEKEIESDQKSLMADFEKFFSEKSIPETIKDDGELVRIYNILVDVYTHLKKLNEQE